MKNNKSHSAFNHGRFLNLVIHRKSILSGKRNFEVSFGIDISLLIL